MRRSSDSRQADAASPFNWRDDTTCEAEPAVPPHKRRARVDESRMSVSERTDRLLRNRWGSPYSKPGAP